MLLVLIVISVALLGAGAYIYVNDNWQPNLALSVDQKRNQQETIGQKTERPPVDVQHDTKSADNESGVVSYEMAKAEKGFMYPEITGFENEAVKAAVNDKLKEKISQYCDCNPKNCDVEADVSYSRNYIFSISVFANWYCDGSAHDVRWQDNVTFDMRSGKVVELADIFGGVGISADGAISDEMAGLMEEYASNLKWPDGVRCADSYTSESLKSYANKYYISNDGVIFSVEFPYVASTCNNDIVIPIDKIKPLAKPNTILDRLIVTSN